MQATGDMDRRSFLARSAAASAAVIVPAHAVRGDDANRRLRLGLIGCGGRGNYLADLFHEDGRASVVAVHDYFRDRVDAIGERLGIDAPRRFVGLDGYRRMLAEVALDAVVIQCPPYFHPRQITDCLDAGMHVFVAKPVAVDVPGALAVQRAVKQHRGRLTVLVDFQTRADPFYQGVHERIAAGLIGEPVFAHACYHSARFAPRAKGNTPTARLRNWMFDRALSGDILVEQNVHTLDVVNWFLRGRPTHAYGCGGQRSRLNGDCYDHFVLTLHYRTPDAPRPVPVEFSSSQFLYGYQDQTVRVFGALGTASATFGGLVNIRARTGGYRGGVTRQIYRTGTLANVQRFCSAVLDGKPISNIEESVQSTLTTVLGRTAAYEQRLATWDEVLAANVAIDPGLDLPENGPDIVDTI